MTTLIKSNVAMTGKALGNTHRYGGPSDFKLMLDFNNDNYFMLSGNKRTEYQLSEVVDCTRSKPAQYLDIDGTYRQVDANEPRLHYLPDMGYRGLLGESRKENYITNPVNPSTQLVTIPTASAAARFILSYQGEGDVTLSHPNLTLESTIGTDKVYVRSDGNTIDATLNVSGSVSKVQLESSDVTGANSTTFILGDAPRVRPADVAVISDTIVSLLNRTNITIVANYIRLPMARAAVSTDIGSLYLAKESEGLGGLYMSSSAHRTFNQNGTDTLDYVPPNSTIDNNQRLLSLTGPYARKVVKTIAYSNLAANVAMTTLRNTATKDNTGKTISLPDIIGLLGESGYRSGAGGASCSAILTHLVIYERKLTDKELFIVAQQWQD